MRRRRSSAVIALTAVLLQLAACSSEDAPDGSRGVGSSPATELSTSGSAPSTQQRSTTSTSTTAPAPQPVSLLFTGDILIHGPVARAAQQGDGTYDFDPMFEPVAPLVAAADVAICHMETAIDDDNGDISGYPLFYAPREVADGVKAAGFDGCSTASNHSLDQGTEGVASTLAVLDRVGLKHAGTGRLQQEAAQPAVYEVSGTRIAHLSYTYGTNGIPPPANAPWIVNLIDPGRVIADAEAARRAGADVVVTSFHWGLEYNQEATADQENVARAVMDAGAVDLIIGHHAHVPQGIRKVAGRWVVFGLGNFVSNQTASCCHPASQDGLMVRVDLLASATGAEVENVVFTPTRVDRAGYRVVPVAEAMRSPDLAGSLGPDELRSSFERTVAVAAATPDPRLQPSASPP